MTFEPVLGLLGAMPRDLILPPANLFLLIVVGLLLCWRWPRCGRVVAGIGFAALLFLSTNAGAGFFVTALER